MPALRGEDDSALEAFRDELAQAAHRLDRWLAGALTRGTHLADGATQDWTSGLELFGGGVDGRLAWRLLCQLLQPLPRARPRAQDALAGPYLGPICAPGPEGLADPAAADADGDACYIDDMGFEPDFGSGELVEVDLRRPLGLVLEENDLEAEHVHRKVLAKAKARMTGRQVLRSAAAALEEQGTRGVLVKEVLDGGAAAHNGDVHPGDWLVGVGPFDVSDLGLDEVLTLLAEWGPDSVHLSLRRPGAAAPTEAHGSGA